MIDDVQVLPQDTETPVLETVIGEPVPESLTSTEPRLFLNTPFEEYTVVEGFMLVFLICLFIAGLYQLVRRFI